MKGREAWLGAVWGIGGVVAVLLFAVFRLAPIAVEGLAGRVAPMGAIHWFFALVSLLFFGYTEGYKSFQRQFSPRVVARGLALLRTPSLPRIVFAPAFCMGFFGATRKRMIVSWSLTGAIVILVALVRALPQPWRGIIDLGVCVALLWGSVAIVAFAVRAAAGEAPRIEADLPKAEALHA